MMIGQRPSFLSVVAHHCRRLHPVRLFWRLYYRYFDNLALLWPMTPTASHLRRYVGHFRLHSANEAIAKAKTTSMLHADTLFLLRYLALQARGVILEIGTYMGGATCVLAQVSKDHGRPPVVAVELGGCNDNPFLPSADILADLKDNLKRNDLAGHVDLVEGASWDAAVVAEVRRRIGSRPIGLLVIDADGNIERELENYGDLMADGCLLAIDDFDSAHAPEKSQPVQDCIRRWVAAGWIESFGVFRWCTWMGRYRKARRPPTTLQAACRGAAETACLECSQ